MRLLPALAKRHGLFRFFGAGGLLSVRSLCEASACSRQASRSFSVLSSCSLAKASISSRPAMRATVASSPLAIEATLAARFVSAKARSSSEGSIRNSPSSVFDAADSLPDLTARQMVLLETPTALAASLRLSSVSEGADGVSGERGCGVSGRFLGRVKAFGE